MARALNSLAETRASLWLLPWLTLACGSQFTDPILSELPPPPAVSHDGATPPEQTPVAPMNPPDDATKPAVVAMDPPACPNVYVARFDGSAFGTAPRLIQDDFTIEAWLSTKVSPSGTGFDDGSALVFADVEKIGTDDFGLALLNSTIVMSIGAPDTAAVSTSNVATGQWVHVAVTRARKTGLVLIFVNGVFEGSAVASTHSLTASPTFTIGGRPGRNLYTGLMSELRLWQVVRSPDELRSSMHHRLNGAEPGLVGYYRLDAEAGSLATDSSPSHNDASFSGVVTWEQAPVPLCEPSP